MFASSPKLLLLPAISSEKTSDVLVAHSEVDSPKESITITDRSIENLDANSKVLGSLMRGSNSGTISSSSNSGVHGNQIRTATGGLINTLMIVLTVFACIGNGLFLIYVFWLSK
eukprot:gene25270-33799_t